MVGDYCNQTYELTPRRFFYFIIILQKPLAIRDKEHIFNDKLAQHFLLLRQVQTEEIVQGLRHRCIHAFHCRQLLHAGSLHSLQRIKRLPKRLSTLRPDALHMVEHRYQIALAAQLAVKGDGKAMRLITNALNQMQGRAIPIE